ncbi:hypothetical protein N0V93_001872 [Gnomoniopsis smithogilvyi]|uniref:Autophagy-related protein 28 n=1 Tax=Gnomoniopsis smithogilvyi TaxID=1191159 RepID=A0A9W9D2L7_9PEZI|nr:hypothetical protein N0V93_001872 [Gnomoniopsis smithogilvyi]
MTSKAFLPNLSLSRSEKTSILPLHKSSRLRSQPSEYDLDELSPRADDNLPSSDFYDRDSPTHPESNTSSRPSNRKPTGVLNRRPSNASSAGSASKVRGNDNESPLLFHGPPPPIAVSRIFYRDEEQRHQQHYYNDDDGESRGVTTSWLPSTAARAISSVIWDVRSSESHAGAQDRGDRNVAFDRNSVWKGLARRERAIVADVQRFLQVQEESLAGESDGASVSDGGSATPTDSVPSRYPGRSVSFLEPVTRSSPSGEIIPVRQPHKKKLGISGARKGISRSLAELANIKAEEDASLASALSTRKQALTKLRKLATRQGGIAEELHSLETDDQEPLRQELEDLDNEHKGVCTEIQDLEKRLASLKSRRRYLEGQMDDVKNRREAGLSGYKNALKEVEDTVRGFLTRPPVKPLDLKALTENAQDNVEPLPSPGGVEFMHLRPERRTIDMAREWWESEVSILEARQAQVATERLAIEEGGEVWEEVANIVLDFETDLRKQMTKSNRRDKGKTRELTTAEALKLQHDHIDGVVACLDERLRIAEEKGWNLLIAAIGAELMAFKEAARLNHEMMTAAGVAPEEKLLVAPAVPKEESGTTGSFHSVNGGSELLDLPNNHEDEVVDDENMAPHDLLAKHSGLEQPGHISDEEQRRYEEEHQVYGPLREAMPTPKDEERLRYEEDNGITPTPHYATDGESSDNEVPPEFLVEHHDERE